MNWPDIGFDLPRGVCYDPAPLGSSAPSGPTQVLRRQQDGMASRRVPALLENTLILPIETRCFHRESVLG
jgi:hypothetical protein